MESSKPYATSPRERDDSLLEARLTDLRDFAKRGELRSFGVHCIQEILDRFKELVASSETVARPPFCTELKDHLWKMYQTGQGSADHTAREVFDQMLDSLSQWLEAQPSAIARTTVREPDGYAVMLDDKASSPKGYWFAYAYIDRETAEKSAAVTKGRVAPIYFDAAPDTKSVPTSLWDEIAEFIEGQVDVKDGSYGEQEPNHAMSLSSRIKQEGL